MLENRRHQDMGMEDVSQQWQHFKHIEIPPYILYIVIGVFAVIILVIVYIVYRKHRTRQMYNETPENFSKKPDLSIFQTFNLNNKVFKSKSAEERHQIERKQNYEGVYYEMTFNNQPSCLYYDNVMKEDAYFEIEIIQLNSIIQIGFIHKQEIDSLFNEDEDGNVVMELDKLGVSLNTDGAVVLYGENKHPYRWNLDYGDVIGIAITKTKKERRAWISKNGLLVNPANKEEMLKNIDISKEEGQVKGDFNKKTQEKQEGEVEEDKFYAKKRLELKSTKKMKYYPVIIVHKSQQRQPTIINVNVGGQTFRMYDQNLQGGILI